MKKPADPHERDLQVFLSFWNRCQIVKNDGMFC